MARFLCKDKSNPEEKDKPCITKLCRESGIETCCAVMKTFAAVETDAPTEPPTEAPTDAPTEAPAAETDEAAEGSDEQPDADSAEDVPESDEAAEGSDEQPDVDVAEDVAAEDVPAEDETDAEEGQDNQPDTEADDSAPDALLAVSTAVQESEDQDMSEGLLCRSITAKFMCKTNSNPAEKDKPCITKLCREKGIETCCAVMKTFATVKTNSNPAEKD